MQPRIEHITQKLLVGLRTKTSLTNNKTAELWRSFMMMRNKITNAVGTDLYSMQVYDATYFSNFNPNTEFEKWATTQVANFDNIPSEMETFTLPSGKYAVFLYKGKASEGAKMFQYIFATWLPSSIYELDNRPHFEVLGDKYKNEDPDSEEEIWIPIKLK